MKTDGEGNEEVKEEEVEVPHARGPDLLGVEDMGLQNGKDVELSLGRRGDAAAAVTEAVGEEKPMKVETEDEEMLKEQKPEIVKAEDEEMLKDEKDVEVKAEGEDGDIVLADAEGAELGMVKDEVKGEDVVKAEEVKAESAG